MLLGRYAGIRIDDLCWAYRVCGGEDKKAMNSVCLEQQGTQQVTHSKRHVFSILSLLEVLEINNSHRQVQRF